MLTRILWWAARSCKGIRDRTCRFPKESKEEVGEEKETKEGDSEEEEVEGEEDSEEEVDGDDEEEEDSEDDDDDDVCVPESDEVWCKCCSP